VIDPDAIVAFDVHVHAHSSVSRKPDAATEAKLKAMAKRFKSDGPLAATVPEIADYYRSRSMACVLFTVDTVSTSGDEPVPSNEELAEQAAAHSDVIVPFASIDPARGKAGVRQARRLVEEHGVRGFKFHPSTQAFSPDDPGVFDLYEVIAEHGLVALFHSGQTGVGAGAPGGGGVRLRYSNPMLVDEVAARFPEMRIILAHPAFPWQDEALAVAMHKQNVYLDLSGWSPKYFPPQLVQYANTLLRHKVLFGSDFPLITPERWMDDFADAGFRDEVRPLVLKDNAVRLLGLAASAEAAS